MPESDTIFWLMAASAVIWSGLGCYVAFLGVTQKGIQKQLQQLEILRHDDQA